MMLAAYTRGSLDDETSWYRGRVDFVQHGQLALLKEAFPEFFKRMPVGLHLTGTQSENGQFLLVPIHRFAKLYIGQTNKKYDGIPRNGRHREVQFLFMLEKSGQRKSCRS
jgi:hypothetical protein